MCGTAYTDRVDLIDGIGPFRNMFSQALNDTTICTGEPGSGCPGNFIEQVDFRHPSNSTDNRLIDPNLKPVRTQEFTSGFDHELTRTMSFGVRDTAEASDSTETVFPSDRGSGADSSHQRVPSRR